jgi:Holliday junction resolvasome RuvABC endonuclease subunit
LITLGVDPGCRNYGLAILDSDKKKPRCWSGRTKRGDWKEAFLDILAHIKEEKFDRVVIESVNWYGRRKGMYALNRLVGALYGYLYSVGIVSLLANPKDKVKLTAANRKLAKNEHEADAIALALYGINYWNQKRKPKPVKEK